MKICIIGPGAIGMLFGSLLLRSNKEVVFLDHNHERTNFIKKHGIKLESKDKTYKFSAPITTSPSDVKDADLFLVCVKSYDTKKAVTSIKSVLNENGKIRNIKGNIWVIYS